jgi:hypothetical protein
MGPTFRPFPNESPLSGVSASTGGMRAASRLRPVVSELVSGAKGVRSTGGATRRTFEATPPLVPDDGSLPDPVDEVTGFEEGAGVVAGVGVAVCEGVGDGGGVIPPPVPPLPWGPPVGVGLGAGVGEGEGVTHAAIRCGHRHVPSRRVP